MIFMEKILSWVKILLLGKKWPKISFLSFITKSWIEFLSIFGFWKLGKVIFTKFLFGGLWDYNALKWLQNDEFEDLWEIEAEYVSIFFLCVCE